MHALVSTLVSSCSPRSAFGAPCGTDNNHGLTFLACWDVGDDASPLEGGSHCILDLDWRHAVVIKDSGPGVTLVGDYRRVLHSNLATRARCGRRLIVTAYTAQSLVNLVMGKRGE